MSIKDVMLHTLSVTFKEIIEIISLIKPPPPTPPPFPGENGGKKPTSVALSLAYENRVFFKFLGSLV